MRRLGVPILRSALRTDSRPRDGSESAWRRNPGRQERTAGQKSHRSQRGSGFRPARNPWPSVSITGPVYLRCPALPGRPTTAPHGLLGQPPRPRDRPVSRLRPAPTPLTRTPEEVHPSVAGYIRARQEQGDDPARMESTPIYKVALQGPGAHTQAALHPGSRGRQTEPTLSMDGWWSSCRGR